MNIREETLDECNKVFEYLADPKSHETPIIIRNKKGDEVVAFESCHHYESEVWTLEDMFEYLIKTDDIVMPSTYAQYRAADLLESYAHDQYYKAMKLKDKYAAIWLGVLK